MFGAGSSPARHVLISFCVGFLSSPLVMVPRSPPGSFVAPPGLEDACVLTRTQRRREQRRRAPLEVRFQASGDLLARLDDMEAAFFYALKSLEDTLLNNSVQALVRENFDAPACHDPYGYLDVDSSTGSLLRPRSSVTGPHRSSRAVAAEDDGTAHTLVSALCAGSGMTGETRSRRQNFYDSDPGTFEPDIALSSPRSGGISSSGRYTPDEAEHGNTEPAVSHDDHGVHRLASSNADIYARHSMLFALPAFGPGASGAPDVDLETSIALHSSGNVMEEAVAVEEGGESEQGDFEADEASSASSGSWVSDADFYARHSALFAMPAFGPGAFAADDVIRETSAAAHVYGNYVDAADATEEDVESEQGDFEPDEASSASSGSKFSTSPSLSVECGSIDARKPDDSRYLIVNMQARTGDPGSGAVASSHGASCLEHDGPGGAPRIRSRVRSRAFRPTAVAMTQTPKSGPGGRSPATPGAVALVDGPEVAGGPSLHLRTSLSHCDATTQVFDCAYSGAAWRLLQANNTAAL